MPSADYIEQSFLPQTPRVLHTLLEIYHPSINNGGSNYIRVCDNEVDVVHLTNTYTAFPFRFEPPKIDEKINTASVTICNVSQEIIEHLRPLTTRPEINVKLVLSTSLDTIENEFDFTLAGVSYDSRTISGNLTYNSILDYNYTKHRYTPELFPTLF